MSVEALLGTDRAFAADLVALRPQPGQAASAANLRGCWRARRSSPATATTTRASRTPTRCAARPQVAGAARDTLEHAAGVADARAASRRSTTRWCCPTGGSSRAATSTARRSASPATSWRSPPPRSARSPSGAPTACSTPPARTGLPPFLADDAGRQLGADDRASTRRRRWSPRTAAWRRPAASTRCRPARCRRTTSRWAGAPPASCDASLANLRRILAVELDLRARAASTCARRCSPPPATAAALRPPARAVARPRRRPLPRARARRRRGAGRARARCVAAVEAVDRRSWQ